MHKYVEMQLALLVELGSQLNQLYLIQKLRSNDIQIRSLSATALGNMEAVAAPVVADLIQMLNDQNEKVRGMAAMALASIGEPAKSAVGADTNAE